MVKPVKHIKPVKKARKPGYPRKEYAMAHPELLERLPRRWHECRRTAAAAGLLAAMSFPLAACEPPRTAGIPMPPDYMSESDVMIMIQAAAKELGSEARQDYRVDDAARPIAYVQYDGDRKTFQEVSLNLPGEIREIDAFHTERGVGFEYIGPHTGSEIEPIGFEPTGRSVERAEKSSDWVLVMDGVYKDDPNAESRIREQVEAFLEWLKAEGIV